MIGKILIAIIVIIGLVFYFKPDLITNQIDKVNPFHKNITMDNKTVTLIELGLPYTNTTPQLCGSDNICERTFKDENAWCNITNGLCYKNETI